MKGGRAGREVEANAVLVMLVVQATDQEIV